MKTYEEICDYLETAASSRPSPFERDANCYYYSQIRKIMRLSKNENACLLSFKEMLRNDLRLSDSSKLMKIISNCCSFRRYGVEKIPSLDDQIKKIFIYAFGN